jgi:hypothetical protein
LVPAKIDICKYNGKAQSLIEVPAAMKWLTLSVDNVDAIAQQIDQVAELYSVLFLKVQHEKQRLLHLLFSNKSLVDREFLKQDEAFFTTLDQSNNDWDSSFVHPLDKNDIGEWDSKINKEKVLTSLHSAIENRLHQLEQFYVRNKSGIVFCPFTN